MAYRGPKDWSERLIHWVCALAVAACALRGVAAFGEDAQDGAWLADSLVALAGLAVICAPLAFAHSAEEKRRERYQAGRREGRLEAGRDTSQLN